MKYFIIFKSPTLQWELHTDNMDAISEFARRMSHDFLSPEMEIFVSENLVDLPLFQLRLLTHRINSLRRV